ncbi:hypothetical protein [Solirubrobacter soli]|uniref:hypothetical protein n=1 Tax=Solirubrobacter soli TaxID=363832 RepID=UPI0012FAE03E|nr:hypothetical protein [Solirubrobacter soli]
MSEPFGRGERTALLGRGQKSVNRVRQAPNIGCLGRQRRTAAIKKSAVERAKIKDNAVDASKVLDNSLTGEDIKESSLEKVPLSVTVTTRRTPVPPPRWTRSTTAARRRRRPP